MDDHENIPWRQVLAASCPATPGDREDTARAEVSNDGAGPSEGASLARADARRGGGLLAPGGARPTADDDLLADLNDAQREAVCATEGYVRVIAGAGTGKTRALTYRFAYLVNELGILPGNILCATFTNKAAAEMRRRIRRLVGDADTGYVNTFHGFCVSVLQEDGNAVQYPRSFLVLDNADIDAMLQVVYEERGLTLRDKTYAQARDMIERFKASERTDYYLDLISMPLGDLRRAYEDARLVDDIVFYGYLYQQKKCFGLDYNDLIVLTLHIFDIRPDIRLKWQRRLEYVMVDEFQDIDGLQHRLMEVLAGHHGNLFVVGDPDQTIYTWRGASVEYLLRFDERFPGTRTIMMLENHRSVPSVLAVANSLIEKNVHRVPKRLEAKRAAFGPSVWYHAKSVADEAAWIAEGVQALHAQGVPYRSMAVLYRAHYASRAVEEALAKAGVPHAVSSGAPFFGRREVKDALSYLRLVAYRDDLSFARVANVPKRNLGQRRMAFLREQAAARSCTLYEVLKQTLDDDIFKRTGARRLVELVERFSSSCSGRPASEVLSEVLQESGYERQLRTEGSQERLDNLAELKQAIYEFETACGEECSVEHYLSHAALASGADGPDASSDKVRLMTIHAAKGLEFPHVFLCSLSEGVLPSRKTRTPAGMEEERRLAFVAMTRARDGLYLTEAEGFGHAGSARYPSRFLLDVDGDLLMKNRVSEEFLEDARASYAWSDRWMESLVEEARFDAGCRVRHAVFGEGRVVAADAQKRAYIVRFDGLETERAISFRAKLDLVE